ncbi:leucyl aminopeptidase family protein [Consotaella salsifontis]|nr:leucyl aminopeptidase family protein [Consotaella salsifontis]
MEDGLLQNASENATPIFAVDGRGIDALPDAAKAWAKATGFKAEAGRVLLVPGEAGQAIRCALLGLGETAPKDATRLALLAGHLARELPAGAFAFSGASPLDGDLAALFFLLGAYRFERYKAQPKEKSGARLAVADGVDGARAQEIAAAVAMVRDLINTPTNDMQPDTLEAAALSLAKEFGAEGRSIVGDALLDGNFPMIHAVGRAGAVAPRLIDFSWGREDAPKVTLVGKGVCFDTGGLDIKPSSSMLLMKKDMGGAANVLGLARLVMTKKLDVRLRVLIPAVENSISASAFRPSDILRSRKGKTVEIGNTDAEGRLVLADALALADEEAPEIIVDMATLTGAARVALGPEVVPFYTADDAFAGALAAAGGAVVDPVWRMPLWQPYAANLASKVADTNNVTSDGFAGSITAALFLEGFVEKAKVWSHFDIYGWRPKASPIGDVGGEAQAIRAIARVLEERYGR